MPRPLSLRFWEKVRIDFDGCWEWQAGKDKRGYGRISVVGKSRSCLAHRVIWYLLHGEKWPVLCVLHRCDNTSCVRPDHLFLGTPADNARDRSKKGRSARNGTINPMPGERNGNAKLSEREVLRIRRMYRRKDWTQVQLARRFGVSQAHISQLVLKKAWRCVK